MDNDILKKAKAAQSPEELLKMAHESGMEDFSEENAKAYFENMHKSGELTDDELECAAGGCKKDGRIVVTHLSECEFFVCKDCGRNYQETTDHWKYYSGNFPKGVCSNELFCYNCKYFIYQDALWLCDNGAHNAE